MSQPRPGGPHAAHRPGWRWLYAALALIALSTGLTLVWQGPSGAASTLGQLAAAKGRYVGVAESTSHLGTASYAQVAGTEFNAATPENEMKWDATEPSRGNFTFGGGDQIVSFAQAHNQKIRGHNLVWHSQLPNWVTAGNFNAATLTSIMQNHITTVATHYAGKVFAWDVVNEPFNEDGSRRTSVFQTTLGDGYIATALRAARAADPNAKLYLNDFNIEGMNAKSNAMFNLISSLKQQGVPIDGVGLESHFILGQLPSSLLQNMQRFANLGVDVAITELDVRMNLPATQAMLNQQANDYTTVVNDCLAVSRCVGVTVWGVDDNDSWVPSTFQGQGAPLLFDGNFQQKPAYTATATALGAGGGTTTPPTTTASSPPPTTTTNPPPPPPGGCRVSYVVNAWNTGFTTAITITNNGSTAINGWTLAFTLPGGQVISNSWNITFTGSSGAVSGRNVGFNGTIPANGGSIRDMGFQATHTGNTSSPTSFTLNGTPCSIG